MREITGTDKQGRECRLIVDNETIRCVCGGVEGHEFVGMVHDTETAVDMPTGKRVASLVEEDDLDKSFLTMTSLNCAMTVENVIHHNSHLVCTLVTPWIYNDPGIDIVSRRHLFYTLFENESTPLDKSSMLVGLMRRMDLIR